MCGIAGLFEPRALSGGLEGRKVRASAMARQLAHRGPDAEGVWTDERSGLALAHRRLSILDLSLTGSQPMISESGRFVLVFNGEIYNFQNLRSDLEARGYSFRGSSDTEVMLAAFEQWGVAEAVKVFDGMFAFAAWDRDGGEIWLARDRIGEKPLYYGWSGGVFLFGSELKALRAHPSWQGQVDRDALSLYFRFNCIPAPYCVFAGIRKLEPGCILNFKPTDSSVNMPEPEIFWDFSEVVNQSQKNPFSGSEKEALDELERKLTQAVSRRMISDVPLGAFLSGGIDSSLIVSLMQKSGTKPVSTFTIGFDQSEYNESSQARRIAAHLGTQHYEKRVTPQDALNEVQGLANHFDEPFSDSSQIPTLMVARHARSQVVVSLSGDGGDELFAGYHRHFLGPKLWRSLHLLPWPLRKSATALLRCMPTPAWAYLGEMSGRGSSLFTERVRKLIELLPSRDSYELYLSLVSHLRDPDRFVLSANEPPTLPTLAGRATLPSLHGVTEEFQYLDSRTYLPDDILTKVDRSTMAVGLEARVPFLAPEIIKFAWSLPNSMKVRNGKGKWILRELLLRFLPKEMIQTPKSGFAVPLDSWLRGSLRDWAGALLDGKDLKAQGYLDADRVIRSWKEHQRGVRDHQYQLWDVLMFQAWLKEGTGVISG